MKEKEDAAGQGGSAKPREQGGEKNTQLENGDERRRVRFSRSEHNRNEGRVRTRRRGKTRKTGAMIKGNKEKTDSVILRENESVKGGNT